jgi:WD40 repeat protein
MPFGAAGGRFSAAAFSRDGRKSATGSKTGTVQVWNADGLGKPVLVGDLRAPVSEVEFSADGEKLLAEGDGLALVGWASGLGRPFRSGVKDARFIGNGHEVLAVDSDCAYKVLHDDSFMVLRRFQQPLAWDQVGTISPDGRWFLTQASGKDPVVWSTERDVEPTVLRGVGNSVTAFASSSDGSRVLTGHRNGWVDNWKLDLDPASLQKALWQATSYCLTAEERVRFLYDNRETYARNHEIAVENREADLVKMAKSRSKGQ